MNNNVVPVKFVCKYSPPIIGLVYKRKQDDGQKRLYEIHLNNLVFNQDTQQVAQQLFLEHPLVLSEKNISLQQVQKLVENIQQKILNQKDEDDNNIYDNFDEDQQQEKQNKNNNDNDNNFDDISDNDIL
ncbi:hypothetical protein PPERSA_12871 [Pseudocohnilembus persalinus]|uniref:Centrosomal protein of 19 kDa n=1 Tax=Pseudocohnilembus persalinus TaxID=266149 RepID=A0A0V0Q818_PSEPJ|nr:hypothetical protein PPERSA_12871 [Pseudocohnilembus persalinus]|eukprot:KRW98392.1 hypothetical protein PPERSA_12871 [Pseudocohnilembus persalinus]